MIDLDHLEQLAEKSGGPIRWHSFGGPADEEPTSIAIFHGAFDWCELRSGEREAAWLPAESCAEAEYAVAAWNAVPELIAEIRRLRGETLV